jgi:uncharacterized protein
VVALLLTVRLTPRGGADAVDGVDANGVLRARVRAPAAEGAANEALCRLLADELGVPRGVVSIERGLRARTKRLRIEAPERRLLAERWPGIGLALGAR